MPGGGPCTIASDIRQSGPPVRSAPLGGRPYVVIHAGQRTLSLTTEGSSSCPTLPTGISAPVPTRLDITVSRGSVDRICTANIAPTTGVVALPAGVDASAVTAVTVTDVTVAGRPVVQQATVVKTG